MLKTTLSLYLLFLLQIAYAQTDVSLQDAIDQQLISVKVMAEGGTRGQSICLLVEKLKGKACRVLIPAGQLFYPSDTAMQTFINVHDEHLVLDQSKEKKRLFALCAEATDAAPGQGQAFAVGELAKNSALKIAQYLSEQGLFDHAEAQYAMWAATNQYPVASIAHQGLLNFTCQTLGLAVPEYRIVQDAMPDAAAGQRALRYKPMRIEGKFTFQDTTARTLTVVLLDEQGEVVRTIIPERPYDAGVKKTFTYQFKTDMLAFGKYQVCLRADHQSVKCIEVEYKQLEF
jgi:hypothetical protein